MDEDYDPQPNDDTDSSSSTSSEGEESLPFENQEADNGGVASFGAVKIATTTCLHAYAIERMKGAEDYSIPWPPLMLIVLNHLNKKYKRRELVTERNIPMLELLLKVPIQLKIERHRTMIDLNDDKTLDFAGMSFVEALEMLRDLLRDKIIKNEHIRNNVPLNV